MKRRRIIVEFKSVRDVERDLLAIPKSKAPKSQPQSVVYFESLASFRSYMTLQKLEILTLIAAANPKSVNELAKMLNRAIAPVQKDCQMLEAAGFIVLEKENGGRGMVTPKLVFQYNRILVRMPEHPYELQFGAAA